MTYKEWSDQWVPVCGSNYPKDGTPVIANTPVGSVHGVVCYTHGGEIGVRVGDDKYYVRYTAVTPDGATTA